MGIISVEHGDRLFWLGRYVERSFTTLKAVEIHFDKMIDKSHQACSEFIEAFGLVGNWGTADAFLQSFIFDKVNTNSVAHSLESAYDNAIMLREEISTEAMSFIQIAMDNLEKNKDVSQGIAYKMLPLEDILFGFWGCIEDYVYDEETKNIIKCGKFVERLDLYFRLNYPEKDIIREFGRLCKCLSEVPKNTPYRYNTASLSVLVEIIGSDNILKQTPQALSALSKLFEG